MSTNPLQSVFFLNKLGFTPWKAELLQQDMELNKKKRISERFLKRTQRKKCVYQDLKSYRSQDKGKHSLGREL